MTGIERLRDIAYDGPYSGGMIHISVQRLREICEQIEREVGVETVKADAMEALAFVDEHGGLDEVKKRLMPEGYRWPRWDDGTPIVLSEGQGDDVVDTVAFHFQAAVVDYESPYVEINPTLMKNTGTVYRDMGEPVARPPKVLDVDGVEIEVGDDLYSVEGMLKFHVSAIDKKSGRIATEAMFALDKWADPKMYAHRAPVLDADGKPLREGETVWNVDGTGPYEVSSIDGNLVKMGSGACINRCYLTHERPDSWEKVWSDVYQGRTGSREMACRCMALAERGQR